MVNFKSCLILIGVFCVYKASAIPAVALSSAERSVASSIASKLDSFMRDDSISRPGLEPVYNHNLDFQLILDSSGSITSSEFTKAKEASEVIAEYIDSRCQISHYGSRVGLIEFSEPGLTRVQFSMGDYNSLGAVQRAIRRVGYDHGSSTATANALRLAKTEFQNSNYYTNARVAWILTDGQSNTGGDPIPEANRLRRMGVTICAVAVGRNVDMGEIRGIANPGCVFEVSSFTSYEKVMRCALDRCNDQQPTVAPDFFSGIRFN